MNPMLVITPLTNAAEAAQKWKKRYFRKSEWSSIFDGDAESVYNKLLELGNRPMPQDVDNIIGNNSWTRTLCGVCGVENAAVVPFSDGDECNIHICEGCLLDAVKAIEGGGENWLLYLYLRIAWKM